MGGDGGAAQRPGGLVGADFPRRNRRLTCVKNELEHQVVSAELELALAILAMPRDGEDRSPIQEEKASARTSAALGQAPMDTATEKCFGLVPEAYLPF